MLLVAVIAISIMCTTYLLGFGEVYVKKKPEKVSHLNAVLVKNWCKNHTKK